MADEGTSKGETEEERKKRLQRERDKDTYERHLVRRVRFKPKPGGAGQDVTRDDGKKG